MCDLWSRLPSYYRLIDPYLRCASWGRDVEYSAASRRQKSIPYPLQLALVLEPANEMVNGGAKHVLPLRHRQSIDAVCRNTADKPSVTAQHRSHLANLDEAFS
jgi:hypothetical protein